MIILSKNAICILLFVVFLKANDSYQQVCPYLAGIDFYGNDLPNMPIYVANINECCIR